MERGGEGGTHDVLTVVASAIQNQCDRQKERIESTTLDRVPDQALIESGELVVRNKVARSLRLLYPPYQEAGDYEVSDEWD